MKRYFFVSYAHESGHGNAFFHTTEGQFFKRKELLEKIKEGYGVQGTPIILHIYEFPTEEDFLKFDS